MTTITFHSDNTSRQRRETMMFGLLRVAAGINILALVGVCVFLLWNGSPAISWEFLTEPPRRMMTAGGVWPCIVGTFLLAFGAMLIAFPLGVASAVYLHEYGGKGRYTRYLRLGISNLAGVPSVVFGLFGLAFFVTFLGMGVSLLAGVLTLADGTVDEENFLNLRAVYTTVSYGWQGCYVLAALGVCALLCLPLAGKERKHA